MAINFNPGLTAGSINTLDSVKRSSETNYQQLSTGQRINSAADDAAGLSIATRIDATTRSLQMAFRNANDGISMLQVADGALSQSTDILSRMRELTLQSANGTYIERDRQAIDKEYEQLASELNRTLENTSFNGNEVFGDAPFSLQVAADAGETLEFKLNAPSPSLSGSSSESIEDRLAKIDDALTQVQDTQADIGAVSNRLVYASDNLNNTIQQARESYSRLLDTDYAVASAEKARIDLQKQVSIAILAQANSSSEAVLQLLGNS